MADPSLADLDRFEAALRAPLDRQGGANPYALHAELQAVMQSLVGIYRTGQDLETAIGRLGELREKSESIGVGGSRAYNPGWDLTFELKNMIICCEAVARSALQRTESRGAHSRIDYPEADPEWGRRNSVVRRDGARMSVTTAQLPPLPDELRALVSG